MRHTRTLAIDAVRFDDDVETLLAAVERKAGVPRETMWLTFEGIKLEPGKPLACYRIAARSTVHLTVRGRGGGCGGSKPAPSSTGSASQGLPAPAQEQTASMSEDQLVAPQHEAKISEASCAAATHAAINAEVARVRALTDGERGAIGSKYTNAEALWTALESILILRGSWLKGQRGSRLPKRGDALPKEAVITVAELRNIAMASTCNHGALPVIALSHYWRSKEHPDPDGETLGLLIDALDKHWSLFEAKRVRDVGVVIDWCALYQAPRTPQQDAAFQVGLKGINQWYAHQGTSVWLVTAGSDRVKGLTYWDKGWTSFEFALAMLIKPANMSVFNDWAQVVDLGKVGEAQTRFDRPPLSEPLAFFGGHAYGGKTYTNGADRDKIVAPKFCETMFEVMGGVRELNFNALKWCDTGVEALAVVLPLCGQLTKLTLVRNSIGVAGTAALAKVLGGGTLPSLKTLEYAASRMLALPCFYQQPHN